MSIIQPRNPTVQSNCQWYALVNWGWSLFGCMKGTDQSTYACHGNSNWKSLQRNDFVDSHIFFHMMRSNRQLSAASRSFPPWVSSLAVPFFFQFVEHTGNNCHHPGGVACNWSMYSINEAKLEIEHTAARHTCVYLKSYCKFYAEMWVVKIKCGCGHVSRLAITTRIRPRTFVGSGRDYHFRLVEWSK